MEVKVRSECPERNLVLREILESLGGRFTLSMSDDAIRIPCRYIREDIGGILVTLYVYSRIAGRREIVFGVDPGSSFTGVVVLYGDYIVYKGVLRSLEKVIEAVRITASELGPVTVFIGDTPEARRVIRELEGVAECIAVPENIRGGVAQHMGVDGKHVIDALKIALRGLYIVLTRSSRRRSSSQ